MDSQAERRNIGPWQNIEEGFPDLIMEKLSRMCRKAYGAAVGGVGWCRGHGVGPSRVEGAAVQSHRGEKEQEVH